MKLIKADSQPTAAPRLAEGQPEIQKFNTVVPLPNGLSREVCEENVRALNQILADAMTLRDLYKKHHWQVSGPTFHQLHELFDKHYAEQAALVDQLAERVQILGGVSVAIAPDVAGMTRLERAPLGREGPQVQLTRLLEAHESLLRICHEAAADAQDSGDDGTNDLLVGDVIRTNEFQVWYLTQHLVTVEGAGNDVVEFAAGTNRSGNSEGTR